MNRDECVTLYWKERAITRDIKEGRERKQYKDIILRNCCEEATQRDLAMAWYGGSVRLGSTVALLVNTNERCWSVLAT